MRMLRGLGGSIAESEVAESMKTYRGENDENMVRIFVIEWGGVCTGSATCCSNQVIRFAVKRE